MTIKEVANLAGVSTAAVSRYINGGSLSENKKEKIRAVIEETGYRPNMTAQSMRTGRGGQIGVIVPKINSDSVSQIVEGVTEYLQGRDHLTILGSTESQRDKEIRYLDLMQNSQVVGIILMGTVMTPMMADAIRAGSKPVVITGQKFTGFPCVYHDDYHAMKDLMQLMIQRGRKKVAYLGVTEEDLAAGLARREGAAKAWEEAGYPAENMPRAVSAFEARDAYLKMKGVLADHPDLDGVLCATDKIALGAMRAVKEAGKSVPKDVSVAGVGDSWAGSIFDPPLTTVHLYYHECGIIAADMLLQRIAAGEDAGPIRQVRLEYTIMDRGSV